MASGALVEAGPELGGCPDPIVVDVGKSWVGMTLLSDPQFGAGNVDVALMGRELDEAAECGDSLLFNGDVFDAILHKDKRSTADVHHPSYRGRKDGLDQVVRDVAEFLMPYARAGLIKMIGQGNHELAVEKYADTDLVRRLIDILEQGSGHPIAHGMTNGFVVHRLRAPASVGDWTADHRTNYMHGSGGQAPVTEGITALKRHALGVQADLYWQGHRHYRWVHDGARQAYDPRTARMVIQQYLLVMTGAYFITYDGQSQESIRRDGRRSNYAADFNYHVQARGGCRVVVKYDGYRFRQSATLEPWG
jgi:hypothetical protein